MTQVRYKNSEAMLARALQSIPLGSQTFSKSMSQFPYGASPFFIASAEGCRVKDVDGNEYIDFINGLLSISLGYKDADVMAAVKKQIDIGVNFSLPNSIEIDVAEKIIEMVPCAEMVRFGKNGSDVTAGAIRIARAVTNRDHVIVCGYHGWQDWFIGSTTRNKGVPKSTSELVHQFQYNDIASLENIFQQYPNQVAAVIMEPMNISYPENNFLSQVKSVTHQNGALFILDEMITGFRFSNGGAQAYFNVIPDLATFGKGVANGYPLSILTGKKEYMQILDELFFSFTFGGECLSLAAALAVMEKLQREPVVEHITNIGNYLIEGVRNLITKHDVASIFSICGHPSWSFLQIHAVDPYDQLDIKTLWMQEILSRGILSFGSHNISYSHTKKEIDFLLSVYDEVFPLIKSAIISKQVDEHIRGKK